MDQLLYYIRDNLVGTHYFIYAFILFFLMFSLIGHLFKQKYAKYDIKIAGSQDSVKNKKEKLKNNKNVKDDKVIISQKTTTVKNNVSVVATNTKQGQVGVTNQQAPVNNVQGASEVNKESLKSVQPQPIPNPTVVPTPLPKPIPQPETVPKTIPTPIPNTSESNSTNSSNLNNQTKPNLSTKIPEI